MTKEGLEKEAEENFKINNKDKDREHYYDRMWFKTGYLAGAEPREKRIEELENQVADIKANCDLAIEGRDIKIKELEKENTELKKESNRLFLEGAKRVEELEKENAELNSDFRICEKNADTYYDQLVKATEIIKKFSEFVNNEFEYDPEHPQEHTDLWNELCEQAEQFIKEIEK